MAVGLFREHGFNWFFKGLDRLVFQDIVVVLTDIGYVKDSYPVELAIRIYARFDS